VGVNNPTYPTIELYDVSDWLDFIVSTSCVIVEYNILRKIMLERVQVYTRYCRASTINGQNLQLWRAILLFYAIKDCHNYVSTSV
jgi:hypothetical protein